MSEKRFKLNINTDDDSNIDIIDFQTDKTYSFVNDVITLHEVKEIVALLNELATKCNQLSDENEQLRQQVKNRNAFLVEKGLAEEFVRDYDE